MKAQSFLLTVDGVDGVEGGLVHDRVADEPRRAGERDAGRREEIALVVWDDLAAVVPPHGHARVGRAEVDADRRAIALQLQAVRHLPSQSSLTCHLCARVSRVRVRKVASAPCDLFPTLRQAFKKERKKAIPIYKCSSKYLYSSIKLMHFYIRFFREFFLSI